MGSQTVSVKLAADHYYTLVNNSSGQPQLIEEPPFKNKQKSLVRVQNLSDKALTLKTADGKTDVVKAVAAKGRGEREINPVKVSLALYDGDKKVGDVKPVALERGEGQVSRHQLGQRSRFPWNVVRRRCCMSPAPVQACRQCG